MADRIMQKEIISDPFSPMFANYGITDTLQEFLALQQI